MIRKVVTRRQLGEPESDVAYWRSRPAAERIAHVEALRAEHYGWADGSGPRLQRVHRVLHRRAVRTDLCLARVLDHLGVAYVTDDEVDAALDDQ